MHEEALAEAAVLGGVPGEDVEEELPLPAFEPHAASPAASETTATVNHILRIPTATPDSLDRRPSLPIVRRGSLPVGRHRMPGGEHPNLVAVSGRLGLVRVRFVTVAHPVAAARRA